MRNEYSARTIDALNQFSKYTKDTITNKLDLRCEFDLPRIRDLRIPKKLTKNEEHQNFLWFQRPRDFTTPSDPTTEASLRQQIIALTLQELKKKKAAAEKLQQHKPLRVAP